MKSARKIAYIQRKRRKAIASKRWGRLLLAALLFAGVLVSFILIKLNSGYWRSSDKFAFVFPLSNGDVGITALDPKADEATTIIVPGDLEVEVAMNYGTLRLKNVPRLAKNENLDGGLLARTITKNLTFPVFLWSGEDGRSIETGNFFGLLKFVFFPLETNVDFGDRLSAALFELQLKSLDRTEIDLAKSQFLTKQMLKDGLPGYRLNGEISARLTSYFSDSDFSGSAKAYISDSTGVSGVAEKVGQIIEVLGGKVVSIGRNQTIDSMNCEAFGKSLKLVKKTARLFGCGIGKKSSDFDLEVVLGSEFARKF